MEATNPYDFNQPHRHDYFEFFWFQQGGGSHLIDYKQFEIKAYSFHVVASGQVHNVQRSSSATGFVFKFNLEDLDAPQEIQDYLFRHVCFDVEELNPEYVLDSQDNNQVKLLFENCWKHRNQNSYISQLVFKNAIQSLMLFCMNTNGNFESPDTNYSKFRTLLYHRFRTMKKVKDYALELGVSEKQLNDLVKNKTGKNTSELIYNQIILEAKRLLLSNISAKETAYNLNFNDPAHFSKFFKSNTGSSPAEFQKKLL